MDGDPVALVRELKAAGGGRDIRPAATPRDEIGEYVIKRSAVLAAASTRGGRPSPAPSRCPAAW